MKGKFQETVLLVQLVPLLPTSSRHESSTGTVEYGMSCRRFLIVLNAGESLLRLDRPATGRLSPLFPTYSSNSTQGLFRTSPDGEKTPAEHLFITMVQIQISPGGRIEIQSEDRLKTNFNNILSQTAGLLEAQRMWEGRTILAPT